MQRRTGRLQFIGEYCTRPESIRPINALVLYLCLCSVLSSFVMHSLRNWWGCRLTSLTRTDGRYCIMGRCCIFGLLHG